MKKVLVLCNGNSCRSQMAEGYLNFYSEGQLVIKSAGVDVANGVHPLSTLAMQEDGIDISHQYSKILHQLSNQKYDIVISVCSNEFGYKDTYLKKGGQFIVWKIKDPAQAEGTEEERLAVFMEARDKIKALVIKLIGTLANYPALSVAA